MGQIVHLHDTSVIGPYKLERRIGQGGMAEVFAATHQGAAGFSRPVCLKKILPHLANDLEFRQLFMREARVAGLLCHTNLVQVFDCIEQGSSIAIVMEFVDGLDLRDIIRLLKRQKETLPLSSVLYILSQILLGLLYAHDQRIVHRDISPHNILISKYGEVKIADFGVAKAMFSHVTKTGGDLKGKLAYMSPEQALGKSVDKRTDLWATGLVLYEMLNGEKLFKQQHQAELLGAIAHAEPPKIEGVDSKFARIVEKLLTPDVDQRYQTDLDVLRDISALNIRESDCIELGNLVSRLTEMKESSQSGENSGWSSSSFDVPQTAVTPNSGLKDRYERPVVKSSPNAPTATREDDVREAIAKIPTEEFDAAPGELFKTETGLLITPKDLQEIRELQTDVHTPAPRKKFPLRLVLLVLAFLLVLPIGIGVGIYLTYQNSGHQTSEIQTPKVTDQKKSSNVRDHVETPIAPTIPISPSAKTATTSQTPEPVVTPVTPAITSTKTAPIPQEPITPKKTAIKQMLAEPSDTKSGYRGKVKSQTTPNWGKSVPDTGSSIELNKTATNRKLHTNPFSQKIQKNPFGQR